MHIHSNYLSIYIYAYICAVLEARLLDFASTAEGNRSQMWANCYFHYCFFFFVLKLSSSLSMSLMLMLICVCVYFPPCLSYSLYALFSADLFSSLFWFIINFFRFIPMLPILLLLFFSVSIPFLRFPCFPIARLLLLSFSLS